ncbi:MAG: hypothetical protein ACOX75_02245 [Lachnospiraceae bacterium]
MGLRKKRDKTDIYGVRGDRPEAFRLPDARPNRSHSKNYHNYFRGYTEVRNVNEKGRRTIQRFYTKPWIVSDLKGRNYWLVRLLYALLTSASIFMYVFAMIQDIPANKHWVVAIPGLPAIVCLFLLTVMLVIYITVPRKMTLWDYESSTKRLKQMSIISAAVEGTTSIVIAGFTIVTGLEIRQSLICAGMDMAAAFCAAAIYFVENKVTYHEEPNETKLPAGELYEMR